MPSKVFTKLFSLLFTLLYLVPVSSAHTVDQVFMEITPEQKSFQGTIFIDAGYCLPELRGDESAKAPNINWLINLTEEEHERLRKETTLYFQKVLKFMQDEAPLPYTISFPDYNSLPYDFYQSQLKKAVLRVQVDADYLPIGGSLQASWADPFEASLLIQTAWESEGEERFNLLQITSGDAIDIGVQIPALEHTPVLQNNEQEKVEITVKKRNWFEFVKTGFDHILPLGLDHILFIIGLFLMSPRWRSLLHQSLIFTLAHSITLAMALSGIVTFSTKWVEVLIALSIVYIAVENLRTKKVGWHRLFTVFVFGLLHGLGFSAVLSAYLPKENILWPLVGFNLGVELGQIIVLLGCLIIYLFTKKYFKWIRLSGSLTIAVIGVYWIIERI